MKTISLDAETRDHVGTRTSRRLRRDGKLPAVVYGHKEATVSVALPKKAFADSLGRGAHLFDLNIAGSSETVLVKEVQYDHLGLELVHVDFTRISLDEKITTHVPITLTGEEDAPGVHEGGVMSHKITEFEVECRADQIPDRIVADVGGLGMGEALHVREISVPAGVTVLDDPEAIIARVAPPRVLETGEEEEAAVEPTGTEPELIGEKAEEDDDDKSEEK